MMHRGREWTRGNGPGSQQHRRSQEVGRSASRSWRGDRLLHTSEEAAESLLLLFSLHQSVGQQLSWELTRDLKVQPAGK